MWPAARNLCSTARNPSVAHSPQSVARSLQPECGPQPAARNLWPAARNVICGPQPAARNLATLVQNLCSQLLCRVTLTFKLSQVWRQKYFRLKEKTWFFWQEDHLAWSVCNQCLNPLQKSKIKNKKIKKNKNKIKWCQCVC